MIQGKLALVQSVQVAADEGLQAEDCTGIPVFLKTILLLKYLFTFKYISKNLNSILHGESIEIPFLLIHHRCILILQ